MAIRVALQHRTAYRYDRPITLGPQVVRLRPSVHARTPVHSYSLRIDPTEHFCNWQQDPYGNFLARLVFPERSDRLIVDVDLVVDMVVFNPFDFFLEESANEYPFTYDRALAEQLRPCLVKRAKTKRFAAFLAAVDRSRQSTIDFLCAVNQQVNRAIAYTIRMEPGIQTPERTLQLGSGSCRDSAWLLCQLLRHCGLATRFVSGYLIQLVADKRAVDGPDGPHEDFTDLHAWCEVYVPGGGWIGLDPTSGLLAGEGHIPLACSPVPSDAAPITGAHERAEVEFVHEMSVRRIDDSGRPLKPYDSETWERIDALGKAVDARLVAGDVRLTSGGEPTFVGSREPDHEQWNTAALGDAKREAADALLRRLYDDWAPGGVLHHGQGKWYPGEPLPRWAYSCYWRKDGMPIWRNPGLFATGPSGGDMASAQTLMAAIAEELAVDGETAFPAYEDPWYAAWQARRFPVNHDPLAADFDQEDERARIVRLLRGDIGGPVACVLPLADDWQGGWRSGSWFLREERCYLMPGDSPVGLRLPLDSLPWSDESQQQPIPDPLSFGRRLPPPVAQPALLQRRLLAADDDAAGHRQPKPGEAADPALVRSALVVEPRDGINHVFLPPTNDPEAWMNLIAAIERAALRCDLQLRLEGYEPPSHPQLQRLALTPDPGVLEVNVPPVDSWNGLVSQTRSLYEHAHDLHLAAEKFDIDGKHTGTGGGCHMTIGGATAADSPLLRRPDLLGSLLTYVNNHPSLSYVFSGSFIGPTSQAPRIDEARQDAVAELELALAQLPGNKGQCPPWLVDRLFRHLLTDVSGNTHRAALCIDKLYSPDHAAGRLGLLEIRHFEMPPHWQLNCAQQLLLRALIATFWERPCEQPLVRWGPELHDRWMLPWYLSQDLAEVCRDCSQAGLDIDPTWFEPHVNFRLPVLGTFARDGVTVELRQAIEPWHVLGEEPAGGAQARYVDSSLERIQVHVRGLTDRRHTVAVNGVELPLHPTGVSGEGVAGVRYRAWQPPSCLHPTIPVHAPLRIDLYDRWHGRAIAGATYHVAHPGGRSHETRPINGNEAEGRRHMRFQVDGHSQGVFRLEPAPRIPEQPHTLDLRRVAD